MALLWIQISSAKVSWNDMRFYWTGTQCYCFTSSLDRSLRRENGKQAMVKMQLYAKMLPPMLKKPFILEYIGEQKQT